MASTLRHLLFLSLALLTCAVPVAANEDERAAPEELITFTTRSGRVYSDVEVTRVTAYSIVVMHSAGMAQIDFEDLPPHVQEKYQYDPDRAEAAKKARQKQAAMTRAAYTRERRRYGKFSDHLQSLQAEAVKFTTSRLDHSLSDCERNARSSQVRQVIADHQKKLLRIKQAVAVLESEKIPEDQILKHLDAVYHRKVFEGMTKEFVLMAWGKPDEVNAIKSKRINHQQWRYRRSDTQSEHLTIIDDKVVEIASISFQTQPR